MASEDSYKSSVYLKRGSIGNENVVELKGQEALKEVVGQAKELLKELEVNNNGQG